MSQVLFTPYSQLVITTQRLILRPYVVNDARQLHAFVKRNEKQMRDYLPLTVAHNTSVIASRRFIRERKRDYENDISCFLGIFLADDVLVGQIAVREINTRVPKCELGYVTDVNEAGKGIAKEAVNAVCEWAFNSLKMQKISLRIEPINTASLKVAASSGFTRIAVLKNDFRAANGRLMDAELWEQLAPA